MKGDSIFGVESKRLKKLAALGLGQGDAAATSNDPFVEKTGDWIGPYHLLTVLGEGGMGIVYRAEQQRPIRRQVAVKLVKPGMDSKKVIARFEAEQQALAVMDHPHVAHVYDAGLTAGGRPYFVMEYVEGLPITEHCDKHKLTIEKRLELFLHVCAAIQHAHYKGIIHRDLKPSNILVATQGDRAAPKIIDFGIAKALTQPLTERTLYTEQGHFVGTPEYMSPEQAEPTAQGIDTRTDIYSLGVVLYELLAGVLPLDAETLREGGAEHIRRIIREEDPKTPSTRLGTVPGAESTKVADRRRTDIRTLGQRLHGDLDWITLKAMEKDPNRRYATAQALAEDIQRHLRHEPVTAGSPTLAYRLRKFVRRHRTSIAAVAGTIVLLGSLAALTVTSSRASRQAQAAAVRRDQDALQAAQEAFSDRRLTEALESVIPLGDSKSVGSQAQLLQASLLVEGGHPQEAAEMLTSLLDGTPEVAGSAHALLARIHWESSDDQGDALDVASHHRQEAERLLPDTADAFYLRALTALTVRETLQMLEKALALDPRHYQSRRLHAHTLWASERYGDMEADALALIVARPRDSLGYLLSARAKFEQGKYEQTLQSTEPALALALPETDRYTALLDLQCRSLLALGQHQRVIADADVGLQAFPEARVLAFHKFAALLGLGDYDRAGDVFYQFGLVNGQPDQNFIHWGIKHVFDTLAAGQPWHPPDRCPEGLPFIHMHEGEANYRQFASKGKRLISKGFSAKWSPDGTKLAYGLGVPGVSGIAMYDCQRQQSELLIVPGKDPRWSPDGQHLVFSRVRRVLDIASLSSVERRRVSPDRKFQEVWVMRSDGSEARRLALGGWPSWSADGQRVFYHSRAENTICEIAAFDRTAQPRRLWETGDLWPSISPDGRHVAWLRGDNRLCVRDMDGASTAPIHIYDFPGQFFWGGTWSRNGRFFCLGEFSAIPRAGLWVYDMQQGDARKILSGKVDGPDWSSDGRTLAFTIDTPIFEIWTADATSLGPGKTLAEHDREMIDVYTRRILCESEHATDSEIRLGILRRAGQILLSTSKPILYLSRANCYARLNELDKAIADIEQAARISGQPERVARWLAQLKAARQEGRAFGQIPLTGSTTYDRAAEAYTLVGSGDDICRSFDECHYTYAVLEGDGSITARIDSVEHVHEYTKAGIMIRNTLASDSERVNVLSTPPGHLIFSHRSTQTGVSDGVYTGAGFVGLPHWVKLTRKGNRFTSQHSKDGVTWKPITNNPDQSEAASVEIPMDESVYVGLVVTSHDTTRTAEVVISNVTITGSVTPVGPLTASQDIRLQMNAAPKP